MRKLFAGLVTAALVLSVFTLGASAHHGRHHQAAMDLVCSGMKIGQLHPGCVDRWGGGHDCWDGHYCVDADGDGLCDNYGHEHCPGHGACWNYSQTGGYIDSDNDGVCDNYDPSYCPGNGTGGGNAGSGNGGYGNGGGHHGGGHHGGRHHS